MHKSNILLGFDFGMRRIGIAVGQTLTRHAQPLQTIFASAGVPDWDQIQKIIKQWQPDALVVGIPLNMDGSEQEITLAAKKFASLLQQHFNLPTYGSDERLTTVGAREEVFDEGGYKALKKTPIDSVAAKIILEHWMSSHRQGAESGESY